MSSGEDSWITITSETSGTGAGLIHYNVAPNTGRVREGYITTDTETNFLITQEGPGSGYIQNPDNGHNYKRYDMLINWQDAETFCEGRGGYLATITSSIEQDFVYTNMVQGSDSPIHQCWLGGFQPPGSTSEPGGDWQWVTVAGDTWGYTNWCN